MHQKFRVGQKVIFDNGEYSFEATIQGVENSFGSASLLVRLEKALNHKSKSFHLPMTHRDSFRFFKPMRTMDNKFISVSPKNTPEVDDV